MKVVNAVIVHSEYGKAYLTQRYGKTQGDIHVIPHGNYLFFTEASSTQAGDCRSTLGLNASDTVVLFFGYVKPYKGLEHLIRAMSYVADSVPSAKLLIAGKAIEPFSKYENLIRGLGLGLKVVVRLGYIPTDKVASYFIASDIVVLPYIATGHNTVAIDHSGIAQLAFAFGKPVIASTVGGLPEVVEHGRSGLHVPPGDARELAAKISQLLSDPARCRAMGDEAARLAKARYSWTAIAEKHAKVYDNFGS